MEKKSWTMPSDVLAVHTEIESWREKRQKRGAIPSSIWLAASELAKRYGVYRISLVLRLNYGALKRRLEETSEAGEWLSKDNRVTGGRCEFVELPGVGTMGGHLSEETRGRNRTVAFGMEIEVSDSSGSRMTVRVMENSGIDIPELVSTFWSKSR